MLTRRVTPLRKLRTKMSPVLFVSSGTRFGASESNVTTAPFALSDDALLNPSDSMPKSAWSAVLGMLTLSIWPNAATSASA